MKNENIIVFDIGGTYFRYNVLNEEKILLEDSTKNKIQSPNFKLNPGYSAEKLTNIFIEKIITSINNIKKRNPKLEINGIGISFAGPVDSNGVVRSAPTLWGDIVKDYPIKQKLESLIPYKVYVLVVRMRKMDDTRKIKQKIFKEVAKFCKSRLNREKTEFIPGKTLIKYAARVYDEKEIINLVDASLDFWLTAGRFAKQFEKQFAKFLGMEYCLLTNSGSSANLLAISALTSPKLGKRRLKPGDEVIATACGFPTTVNPILQNNLVPVFIDVELGTYNIDVRKIEKAIRKRTKAIFVAHTLGNPVDLDKILKIVKKYNLFLIEDNCDSLGSKYKGRYTGTFGHISTLSFYPAHHLTMGEGGAVLINDSLLKRIILSFRDWGRDCWCEPGKDNTCGKRFSWQLGKLPFGYDHKYIYSHIGYNLKVTDMQAAIGVAQLKKLPKFIEVRKKNFTYLYNHLKKYEKYFILPQATRNSEPSWFGFPILLKENAPFTRADIVNYLEKNRIATRMLFGGNLTKQPAYEDVTYRISGSLKNTDLIMNNLFWIGVYPGLTEEMIGFVISRFRKFFKTKGLI